MKISALLFSAFFAMLPHAAQADGVAAVLEGTWIETVQTENYPRTVLHFQGSTVRFENMFGTSASAGYSVTEKKDDGFSISFEYRYKAKRGNGRIVERRERPDFLFHVENGRPILSETAIELDGRGLVILSEYLRKEEFINGFESELRKKLNSRKPVPTTMGE